MEHITVYNKELPCYQIQFHEDFNALQSILETYDMKNKKVCIVSDSNVSIHYLQEVVELVSTTVLSAKQFVFPAGEVNKNLDTVYELYDYLIKESFDRKDILIALGGGVVGDLTGYVAATYLRGIEFIQVPTSLLSMVDSSIGGKTGVDFMSYKNMIGAFHQPKLVYINLNTLNTLDKREYVSGLAEIIKHGLIKDKEYMVWMVSNRDKILEKDYDILYSMISTSCNIKREVVELDPTEKGDRALLNFGHTLGHSIEKFKEFKLLHGECVSIGMVAASHISYMKGYIKKSDLDEIVSLLDMFSLPTSCSELDSDTIISTSKSDKKMESGKLKFILLNNIGHGIIDTSVNDDDLHKAIDYISIQ